MSGLSEVVIVRTFFLVLDETGRTRQRRRLLSSGCRQCEAAELWREGGLNVTHAGGRQWHRFWRFSRHGRRTALLGAENREMVLVAPNAANLLDRGQACTAPTIREWVDSARTRNILRPY